MQSDKNRDAPTVLRSSPGGARGKEPTACAGDVETQVRSLCLKDPLEEGMATPSSSLAWRIPWTEDPGGL